MRIPPAEPYPFRGMGFIKAAAITPSIRVGDCVNNAKAIAKYMQEAAAQEVSVAVFPELCLTGSTCGDLFFSPVLLGIPLRPGAGFPGHGNAVCSRPSRPKWGWDI